MKKFILILFLFCYCPSFSQTRNSIWCFGDSAGIDFSNTNNPTPLTTGFDGRGSCVSVSDSSGNLILYAGFNYMSQSQVFNSAHDSVLNSYGIYGDGLYTGMTLVSFPNAQNKYYLFCRNLFTRQLYYNILYPDSNNGLGLVSQKNILVDPNIIGDCVTAIKHGNGRDWWLITKYRDTSPASTYNRFFVYLVTADSIYNPIITDFNDARDADFQKIVWHPYNDKFMLINISGYMSEFSFDRCSGGISLIRNIFSQQFNSFTRLFWEGAYTASGNVFYVSTDDYPNITDSMHLLQIDLNATNIAASIDTLDTWTTNDKIAAGAVRLAPDNKVYFSRWYLCNISPYCYPYPDSVRNYVNENLSVINSPDSLGPACNYQPFSFYLGGKRTYLGLPNNPNYDLGPVVGSICDTLTVSVNSPSVTNTYSTLTVFYHPAWQTAFINAQHLKGKHAELFVYDETGQLIFKTSKNIYDGYYTYDLDMSAYSKGMYIVSLRTDPDATGEMLVRKVVKQ